MFGSKNNSLARFTAQYEDLMLKRPKTPARPFDAREMDEITMPPAVVMAKLPKAPTAPTVPPKAAVAPLATFIFPATALGEGVCLLSDKMPTKRQRTFACLEFDGEDTHQTVTGRASHLCMSGDATAPVLEGEWIPVQEGGVETEDSLTRITDGWLRMRIWILSPEPPRIHIFGPNEDAPNLPLPETICFHWTDDRKKEGTLTGTRTRGIVRFDELEDMALPLLLKCTIPL
jgi:hypothetical protein